jgi:hypothetical protein
MRSNRRLFIRTVLRVRKSGLTERACDGFFRPPPQTEQKQKRRREADILPSDRRCTGTQKLQRRGQNRKTVRNKSRLLDRIVWGLNENVRRYRGPPRWCTVEAPL